MRAHWNAGATSQQGRRTENQDRMTRFSCALGEVVAVADGMGGQRGGATAAATVTARLPELLRNVSGRTPVVDALRNALGTINAEIYREGHGEDATLRGMGTTVVIAVIRETPDGAEALIGNIGDSPAFLVREGALQQISKDHTAVQRLVDAGALSAEEARRHPESSVLSRAIGQQPEVELELYPPVKLQPGDGLLLCSDGLSGYVDTSGISSVLRREADANRAVEALFDLALQSGSDDNVTIQYLRLAPAAPATAPKRRNWRRYAVAAAMLMAAGAVTVRLCACKPPLEKADIVIQNATGEPVPPPKDDGIPGENRGAARPLAIVYSTGDLPPELRALRKSACVELRTEAHAKLAAGYREKGSPRLYFRPGAEAARDCIRKELKTPHVIQTDRLPKGVQVLIVVDPPVERDAD